MEHAWKIWRNKATKITVMCIEFPQEWDVQFIHNSEGRKRSGVYACSVPIGMNGGSICK